MPPKRSAKSKITRKSPQKPTPSLKEPEDPVSWQEDDLAACLDLQKRATLRSLRESCSEYVAGDPKKSHTNEAALIQLKDLLQGTFEREEGNSCLLLGPRGSGKSTIADQALRALSETHNPVVVRLSGWMQHNDRLAMREIAAQLQDQTGKSLLSNDDDDTRHEDQAMHNEDGSPKILSDSVSSHLPTLISLIPTLSRPTVIILDAFDLFALHARQALLYCLLDTAQSCRAGSGTSGLAIIGLSSRVDTINLLEKRVKSRFSGRVLRSSHLSSPDDWVARTKRLLCPSIDDTTHPMMRHWRVAWSEHIDEFFADMSVVQSIQETFSIVKDYRAWNRIMISLTVRLTETSPWPLGVMLQAPTNIHRTRSRLPCLSRMSYSSLCLLIASVHAETAGYAHVTFEMLHEYFRDQVRASGAAPVQVKGGGIGMVKIERSVLATTFEALIAARIFVPAGPPSWNISKEFVKYRCAVNREDVRKAIDATGQNTLKRWLTKN